MKMNYEWPPKLGLQDRAHQHRETKRPMIRNSLICKLINDQARIKEINEKKIKNCDEISKIIKVFPKDIAALDKRSVLAKVSSQGSGR